jgi:stress responsive alpha/beta barrel protein
MAITFRFEAQNILDALIRHFRLLRNRKLRECGSTTPLLHNSIVPISPLQVFNASTESAANNQHKPNTMFSHVVIFWTDPANPKAADELLAGMNKYLRPITGVLQFHAGRMAPSHRPVVEQSYQVALNLVFADKKAQDDYQAHPLHVEFVEKVLKPLVKKVTVYDFE